MPSRKGLLPTTQQIIDRCHTGPWLILALMVGLQHFNTNIEYLSFLKKQGSDIVERLMSVNLGLALAEQIEIGAIYAENTSGHFGLVRSQSYLLSPDE